MQVMNFYETDSSPEDEGTYYDYSYDLFTDIQKYIEEETRRFQDARRISHISDCKIDLLGIFHFLSPYPQQSKKGGTLVTVHNVVSKRYHSANSPPSPL